MDDALLRLPQVIGTTGLGKTEIYARVKAGSFPRPVKLATRLVAWSRSEVAQWVEAQKASRARAA